MKAYVLTTGILFALLVVAHVVRAAVEGVHVVRDPVFAISTLIAVGICAWAVRLLRRMR